MNRPPNFTPLAEQAPQVRSAIKARDGIALAAIPPPRFPDHPDKIGSSDIEFHEAEIGRDKLREIHAVQQRNFEMHSAIFNAMPASVAVIDGQGAILEVNNSWKNYAGINPLFGAHTEVGDNYLTYCQHVQGAGASDARGIADGIRRVLAGEASEFLREYLCHFHGEKRWFRLRATPFRSSEHEGAMVIYTDITKRGEAEESLRQAEFKYRSIFENATEGIFQTTPDGRYLSANPMLAKIYGYDSPEELMRSVKCIARQLYVNPVRREQFIKLMAEKGFLYQFESVITRKDGKIIWISENARSVRDQQGNLMYYEGTVEDITELKNAEERIRDQAALLDKANDAIMVQDLLHRIQYWNQSAERIYGWTALEIMGKNSNEIIYQDLAAFQKALTVVLVSGGWSGELKQVRKDGTVVIVETSLTLVRDADGQPKSILAINTDVTEKKRLEKQLVHSQRMESVGTLAGGIAHDFNNILAIISGYANFGRSNISSEHLVHRHLSAIERAAKRAEGVVRQILTFSRRQEPERRIIKVQPIIQEALEFLRSTLPARIEIHSEFAPALPPIMADGTQIYQIIMNLGTNAAHAMSSIGGRLDISVRVVNFDAAQARQIENLRAGAYVCTTISDTGRGMDQQTLQRIFEPFFTTKRQGEGSGLGLAVVHGIVKNHDGAITVNSEPGQGTVFHLYFPALDAEAVPAPTITPDIIPGQGQKVIYVDDEEDLVFLTTVDLEKRGFAVSGFHLPEKALDVFRENPWQFDAAAIDMSMPKMDGPELVRQMLSIRPDFPVVMVSGFVRPEDIEKVRCLGIKKLIEKPETVLKLGTALEQLFRETLVKRESP